MADRIASVAVSKFIPTTLEPPGLMQKESDRAVKPGFRAPPNTKSKAQKKPKRKKR